MHTRAFLPLLGLAGLLTCSAAQAAGTVAAMVERESLILFGDVDGNHVVVTQGGTPDEMIVTGAGGTLINGNPSEVLTGITRNVVVFLFEGNDQLEVNGVDVPLNLDVESGTEDDTVTVLGGHVGRNVRIGTGMGLDNVYIDGVTVAGHTAVSTDFDADVIQVTGATLSRKLKLSSGHGADMVTIDGNSLLLDNLIVRNIDGDDIVAIADSMIEGNVKMSMGNDPDFLSFQNVASSERVIINGGDGTDTFDDLGGNSFATAPVLKGVEIVQ